jgi:NAD(P)-dependent dehydrogenase (short-subunit alcohol dehydrogenase family)
MARILYIVGGTSHVLNGFVPQNDFNRIVFCGRKNVYPSGTSFLEYDLRDPSSNSSLIEHISSHDLDVAIIYASYVSEGMSDRSGQSEIFDAFKHNCFMPVDLFSGISLKFRDRKVVGVFISSIYAHVSPKKVNYKSIESQNPLYYGVFKAGVEQAVRWLSTQVRDHWFNCIVLGPMPNQTAQKADPQLINSLLSAMPSERMVHQYELSHVINLLIRDDLVSLRGESIVLDGGYTLW